MDDEGVPDPERAVEGVQLDIVMRRLAARVTAETGDSELRALAELRLAVEKAIRSNVLLAAVPEPRRSWRGTGKALGVSAQAAHRRYGRRSRSDNSDAAPPTT